MMNWSSRFKSKNSQNEVSTLSSVRTCCFSFFFFLPPLEMRYRIFKQKAKMHIPLFSKMILTMKKITSRLIGNKNECVVTETTQQPLNGDGGETIFFLYNLLYMWDNKITAWKPTRSRAKGWITKQEQYWYILLNFLTQTTTDNNAVMYSCLLHPHALMQHDAVGLPAAYCCSGAPGRFTGPW